MVSKTIRTRSVLGCIACALAAAALLAAMTGFDHARADEDPDPALKQAREQVKMLDSLYKNAVVSITKRYKDGPPAIMVAKDVFGAMDKDGWHSARLVGVLDKDLLLNESNAPKSEFEQRAAEQIKAGKPYYEEVLGEGNERRLAAATVVPAVLPRCASCHGVVEGDLLGFIRYEIPVK